MSLTDVPTQLGAELRQRISPLAMLAGPDAVIDWPERLTGWSRIESITHALLSGDDDEAARMALEVMAALWPTGDPPPEWWATPLGHVLARSVGAADTETVTHSVAAAMLGVTRGTVAQLVHRGKLERSHDGGILRASVLQRIASRS